VATDSDPQRGSAAALSRPGKRDRLVAAACDLTYRQGVARTTLADIAGAADVPLGNVYYYFKTKDDIIGAVVESRTQELRAIMAGVEGRHRSPERRLTAFVRDLAARAATASPRYGCPYGTLGMELARQTGEADSIAAPLMQVQLDWIEQHFRAVGRRDARDLAVELLAAWQGAALLTSVLRQPELMAAQARRLEAWIASLIPA
jgi:AcrR family transcriptional regulator